MAQSAVEWLSLYLKGITSLNFDEIVQQAKQMEKEQHSDTWDKALDTLEQRGVYIRAWEDFDEYYNNKFKK